LSLPIFMHGISRTKPHSDNYYIHARNVPIFGINIICVAATNKVDHLAYFSNYGILSVDLGAPGKDIFTTWSRTAIESPGEYMSVSGSFFAAPPPHVAGAAALIWSMYPDLDHFQVKGALLEGGESNPYLSGKTLTGKDLDLHEAINYIQSTY